MTASLVLIIFLDAAKGYFVRATVLSVYGITWQARLIRSSGIKNHKSINRSFIGVYRCISQYSLFMMTLLPLLL